MAALCYLFVGLILVFVAELAAKLVCLLVLGQIVTDLFLAGWGVRLLVRRRKAV